MLPGPTFSSQTDLSPKVIVCPLLFKKHNMKQGLFGRVRTGEGRYWGFFMLPTLATAQCNPGKQKPMHKNVLAEREKRCLDETKRARCHGVTVAMVADFAETIASWGSRRKGLGSGWQVTQGQLIQDKDVVCFCFCFVFFFSFPPLGFHGEEAGGGCF